MRTLRIVLWTGALLVAGCVAEPTGVDVVPASVLWLEWPKAVSVAQPGALRVTGYAPCPYRVVFDVTVSGSEIRLTAEGRGSSDGFACPADAIGLTSRAADGGAGYDTLLPLPRLTAPSQGLPAYFQIWAPMAGLWGPEGDRIVGGIWLRATADTATQFAGPAVVFADSSGCWRMGPWSRGPAVQWALTEPVPLAPRPYGYYNGYYGNVSGRFVLANPPICGDSIAVLASRLEVDVTPRGASLARSR